MVGELATNDMIVVLNKVDLLPEEGRNKIINKAKKRLSQTLNATKFAGCTMVPTAVKSGTATQLSPKGFFECHTVGHTEGATCHTHPE